MGRGKVRLQVYGADVRGVRAVRLAVYGAFVQGGALAARGVHGVQVHHGQGVVQNLGGKKSGRAWPT